MNTPSRVHRPSGLRRLLPAAALLLAVSSCRRQGGVVTSEPVRQGAAVTVAKPIAKPVMEWDEFTGRLAAPESVEVRARVSGYLEKRHFQEGSEVQAGDVLFTIDARPYEAIVERATAELERSRIRAKQARAEADRAEVLIRSRAIATEDYDARVNAAVEAEAAVRAAEAALKAARLDLEFTTVRAPISGRISYAPVTEGNLITGGERDSTLLTTIVSIDPIYCYLEVDEQSALKYRRLYRDGKRRSALFEAVDAEMGLANETGFPHRGKIDFVDNVLRPNTGTIRARAVFPNPDKLMAPGFFARVRVPGSGEYPALLIRDEAVGNDQGQPFVYVVDGEGKVARRTIQTGPIEDGLRIVRSGLNPDDSVIINGMMNVRDGATVRVEVASMTPETHVAKAATAQPAQP